MKSKLLLVIAAMFIAASAFAQPANITWWVGVDLNELELYPLPANCDGSGGPLPNGRMIVAYWDANNNGPDAADQPWPLDNCNYNTQYMNGFPGEEGTFSQDYAIWIVQNPPAAPNNGYYLKIFCADNETAQYVTTIRRVTPGPTDHFWFNSATNQDLTCSPCGPSWVCQPQQVAILTPPTQWEAYQPLNVFQCVELCYQSPVVTVVVPVHNPTNIPHVVVIPGCLREGECFDPECPPALGILSPWVYNANPPTMVATLTLEGAEGCVCLWLDFIEPAEITNFTAVARDASVELTWNASFNDLDHFEITRSDNVVFTTSETRYTDNSAENGTTYTYSIVAVNVSGARSEAYTSNAVTPSMRNAVITEYKLHQNFPNPFNPSTQIRFDLVENNFVSLKVYNAAGQEVATVVNGMRDKGVNLVEFDASNLTSGLYFYTVKIGNEYSATKKMLLVK